MNIYYVVGILSCRVYYLAGETEDTRVVDQMRIIAIEKNKVGDGVIY